MKDNVSPLKIGAIRFIVLALATTVLLVAIHLATAAVTIGRAPTNQIVIKDERCSRTHVEVFTSGGRWTIRDLESRNGTFVGEELIKGDRVLQAGDLIRRNVL